MKKVSYAIAGAALAVSSSLAAITASPMLVFIQAGNNVQDITVQNPDADTAYVSVTPTLVHHPGTQEVKTVFTPGMSPQDFGLMVSPLKLAVQGNSERKVRLVNLNANPTKDVYYVLSVMNVSPPAGVAAPQTSKVSGNFDMSYGYKIKVMVLPAHPLPVVKAVRTGSSVVLTNTGNSYISLRGGQLCDTQGNNCASLPEGLSYHVLYSGDTWNMALPKAGVVKFNGVYGLQNQRMSVQSN